MIAFYERVLCVVLDVVNDRNDARERQFLRSIGPVSAASANRAAGRHQTGIMRSRS
ncbi:MULTISPECIES: hypothetical protein [Burkholderia]|uniref:hypothetical protein n=1 Tax=Burkholderia TaxID=32008 RepID=UPI00158A7F4A|nr:hypothetical protein [Burkholderia ambifaria]